MTSATASSANQTKAFRSSAIASPAIPLRTRYLFLAVVLAQFADLMTFLPAVGRVGIGPEQNPLTRSLFIGLGAFGPAVVKVLAITAIVLVLYRVAKRYPAMAVPPAVLVLILGLFGAWSNVAVGLVH